MPLNAIARAILWLFGGALVVVGAIGTLVGILAMLDPTGTQMANDADPFGTPPTFESSAWRTAAFVGVLMIGAWVCDRLARQS